MSWTPSARAGTRAVAGGGRAGTRAVAAGRDGEGTSSRPVEVPGRTAIRCLLGDVGLLVGGGLRGAVDRLVDDRVLLAHGRRLAVDRAHVGCDGGVDRGRHVGV